MRYCFSNGRLKNLCLWIAVACALGCASQRQPVAGSQPSVLPEDAVILIAGASQVTRSSDYDGGVKYSLDEPYPPTSSTASLEKQLSNAGWRVSEEDLFNPGKTTRLRAWTMIEESDKTELVWTGYWQNANRDVLMVTLHYPVIREGANLTPVVPLQVEVLAFSKATADGLRRIVR